MPYGESLDFSFVTLPGVGGQINASNAISTEELQKKNKSGLKWSPTKDGGLAHHNESLLDKNRQIRARKEGLINREYSDYANSQDAMKEIMDRRKARNAEFQRIKKEEYKFADDTELMAIPQPFASSECQSCKSGKCSCPSCSRKGKVSNYREWTTDDRKDLKDKKVKGDFAGPNMSFPIAGPKDVAAAWSSVGRAANPREVMAKIIKIAIKYGWTSGLPDTVRQRMSQGQSGLPE
jgi:hypothetical protein